MLNAAARMLVSLFVVCCSTSVYAEETREEKKEEKKEEEKKEDGNEEPPEQGNFTIELGYLLKDADGAREHSTPMMLTFAVTPWLQLQTGSNGYTYRADAQFFDDMMVGLKLRLHEQSDRLPELAFSALLDVPTVDGQEGYVRNYDVLLATYLTKEMDWFTLDVTLGLNLWQVDAVPLLQMWGALTGSFALPYDFTAQVQLYGINDASPVSGKDAGLAFGVGYAPTAWLGVDVGADVALMREVRSYSLSAGLTITPPFHLY